MRDREWRQPVACVMVVGLAQSLGEDDQRLVALRELGQVCPVRAMIHGNSGFSLPFNVGFSRSEQLDAGTMLMEVLSGSADSLASVRLREPGASRAGQLSAGAATDDLQLGDDPDGDGFDTKFPFEETCDVSVTINLPVAFPTAIHNAIATGRNNTPSANFGCVAEIQALTLTQLTAFVNYHGSGTSQLNGFFWMALGE